jgi:hypothetical protein
MNKYEKAFNSLYESSLNEYEKMYVRLNKASAYINYAEWNRKLYEDQRRRLLGLSGVGSSITGYLGANGKSNFGI